ncbi:uncharacterized protein BX663DRAFT_522025 [Cokeromyces recurvatus]|uniref:uncharacterized protein n=1 Tax=Cokeromyces recurvatus TaxID=90255 RepID=UPI00221E3B5A|nr:uncharacterized protein BX663DRAFT_522025 [Cokeromyces recurvatus]KAI7899268.1 hypothetical protein BX663DRAFT_522025 [Cokeromyces recurvatus]
MTISLRIVHLDHYMAIPDRFDRKDCPFTNQKIQKTPVLRIFGSIAGQQKICVHIHQVYPYFFIPYDLPIHGDIERDMFEFGTSLNEAMNLATHTNKPHIAAIILTKGKAFYGFCQTYQLFLKIYFLDPQEKQQMLDILQSGAMTKVYQPYEAHLNFELQFLIDHNLYGMDWMHVDDQEAQYRSASGFGDNGIQRQSYCELEMDMNAIAILNRRDLINSENQNATKLVKSLETIWRDELDRRRERGIKDPIPSVTQIKDPVDPEPWLSESIFRKRLEKMLNNDAKEIPKKEPVMLENIMTTFEAVEALYKPKAQRHPFHISSTTHEWELLPSQLDKDILNSFIEESILEEGKDEEQQQQVSSADNDDYSYFDDEDEEETNEILTQWLEEANILSQNNNNNTEKQKSSNVNEEESFQISDIPPDPMFHIKKRQPTTRLVSRIEQVDGLNDSNVVKQKKLKTAAELWEEEKRVLKRMRLKKSETDMQIRKQRLNATMVKSSTITIHPTDTHEQRSEIQQEDAYLQKVSVVIHRYPERKQKTSNHHRLQTKQTLIQEPKVVIVQHKKSQSIKSSLLIETDKSSKYSTKKTTMLNDDKEKAQKTPENQVIMRPATQHTLGEKDHKSTSRAHTSICHAEEDKILYNAEQSIKHKSFQPSTSTSTGLCPIISPPFDMMTQSSEVDDDTVFNNTIENNQQTGYNVREFVYNHAPPFIKQFSGPISYREPFYSKASDRPSFPTVFAGKEFKLPIGEQLLEEFKSTYHVPTRHPTTHIKSWTLSRPPPSFHEVQQWIDDPKDSLEDSAQPHLHHSASSNPFQYSATKPKALTRNEDEMVTFFSLEVHVNTREGLLPDPQYDAVQLVFWCLKKDLTSKEGKIGLIAMHNFNTSKIGLNCDGLIVDYVQDEKHLISLLIEKVRYYDPDMLVGYEVQNGSWGYLIERGAQLGFHLLDELSRVIVTSESIKRDEWGYKKASMYKVLGRHLLNVWRILKHELTLTSYTIENVAYHLLHTRIPYYSHSTLTNWYSKGIPILKNHLIKYYTRRVQLNLDLLDASQVISRTCESARIYGIDFYAVLTRGSQYVVESILFRIAKLENYVLITPNRKQVAAQRSLEVLPLVMEPISRFYSSPMAVLDFQSLYPSVMIAYNYCYSTCLGRIRKSEDNDLRFGVLDSFEPDKETLNDLKDYIHISPNGVMFVKPEIRKSTLAKMLEELLDTRVMVKRAMKDYEDDPGLLRMLNAKQMTLKLVANVTYGYTSASFSGRMPCVEIADSIVATGREILERTIRLINETKDWGAQVVYGDTDSVFVYFPGKSKEEAFKLGNEIANTVTRLYPTPVKLKFEKIYHPSVLLAKKRYVGFKYESSQNTTPIFEAKGIETVRRDGTAATQKILESSLKILFRTQDMSELKEFLYEEWTKILSNRVSLQDFIISKEVRMGTYAGQGPNGAVIARANINLDPRAEPQYNERVPYVVVYRGPNARLRDKVVRPETLLNDSSLRLDAEYYIRKQVIPPLSRVFNLMGVNILSWYESMPQTKKAEAMALAQIMGGQQRRNLNRIDQYYASLHCIVCSKLTDQQSLCKQCQENPMHTIFTLTTRQKLAQQKLKRLLSACQACSKLPLIHDFDGLLNVPCESLDCPIFYQRLKAKEDVQITLSYDTLIQERFKIT